MGNVAFRPADMEPELSTGALSFDRRAREPLFFADALLVAVAMLVQALVLDEQTLNDQAFLPHADHREILDKGAARHRPFRRTFPNPLHRTRRARFLHRVPFNDPSNKARPISL
jgi:hypothetical protein